MTLLLIQIHFETNIFLSTKVIWEGEKRGLMSYLSAWGGDRCLCLKDWLPSWQNEMEKWRKNGNKGRDVLGDSRKRYRCPWVEIRKYGPHLKPIRLKDSLPCPLRNKIISYIRKVRPFGWLFHLTTSVLVVCLSNLSRK